MAAELSTVGKLVAELEASSTLSGHRTTEVFFVDPDGVAFQVDDVEYDRETHEIKATLLPVDEGD